MADDTPRGIDLDVVERCSPESLEGLTECGIVKVNKIRINGQAVLVPKNTTIEFETGPDGVAVARLSLFVRNLRVGFEEWDNPDGGVNLEAANAERFAELLKAGTVINHDAGLNLRAPEPAA